MRNPDWSTLPTDLVVRISSLLIADDASDFVRLRAVCRPWRSSTVETKSRADCFCPRNWIMLSDPNSSPSDVCFFNTSTHKSFSFDLTPYLDTYSLLRSLDYLFLLKHKITQGFALLNPLMKSITPLPSKIEPNCANVNAPKRLEDLIVYLSGVFVTSSFTIVLRFILDFLVWTKPGDQSWVYDELNLGSYSYSKLLFYKDRLLAVTYDDKRLVQIDLANEIPNQLQVEVVFVIDELPPTLRKEWYLDLVDCDGEIILVTFKTYPHRCCESLETYKLDLNEKTYVRSPNLDNHSIFLGIYRTFSISCEDLPQVPTNSIYLCALYWGDSDTECYNLKTKHMTYQYCEPFLNPSSLVEKLIKCYLRSYWNIVSEDDE
ncbi:F-box SKIP23-like protein (DUF295) [Rhynchospora pubera]|uniref:F-box SKIP23-like protein (DUF295) n=1 Tax=Rhynchospora pubera TaxID=906938 RepID=A0AAV8E0H5_9POAL|nr:F-box SKIP23-like protein (DUF295) [Rhynchospora pubera]